MAGSNTVKGVLSELAKRVPKNQLPQLKEFLNLHAKYNDRVNKYPAKLPTIDWDYYRTNLRIEAIKMVDEFEKKYEELNKVFDDRIKLDTKKYYEELEKQRAIVQAEVNQYIAESNKRIKAYEAEMERLCLMKPYSSMTMEEYITLRPEHADCIPHRRKPLFWPHDPDEQIPGPVGIKKPDDGGQGGGGSHPVVPSDFKGKTEKFEFSAGEAKAAKTEQKTVPTSPPITEPAGRLSAQSQPVEVKAAPPEVKAFPAEGTKDPCEYNVQASKPSTEKIDKQKIHIDKPTSEEVKKKLDPCNLIEKEVEVKSKKDTVEQQRKPHPCDMVKKKEKESTTETIDTCKSSPKGPYKDEKKESCVFLDPCKIKFGAGANNQAKSEMQTIPEKKATTKPKTTEVPKQPQESKKPHPCDFIKKKEEAEKNICKNVSKQPYADEKRDSCVFLDPCKSGFGAVSKATDSKVVKSKPEEKPVESCQLAAPKENKLSQPHGEQKKSKMADKLGKDGKKDMSSSKVSESKSADNCSRTPYYNPFRSEEENIRQEKEACDECNEEEEPCKDDKHTPKTPYYNPFKDEKK